MSTFVIGDVHGCLQALEAVMSAANPVMDDTVIFLGDYVDRGPHSAQVLDWILQHRGDKWVTLLGNHEIMMMDFRDQSPDTSSWLEYGGAETLQSYGIEYSPDWHKQVPDEHWQFLENTLPYFEAGHYIFVHAGLQPGIALEAQMPRTLFWDKYEYPLPYAPDKRIVTGHTARKNGLVADYGHTINIDTYVYGGQWLTCLEVDSGKYWQGNQQADTRIGHLA